MTINGTKYSQEWIDTHTVEDFGGNPAQWHFFVSLYRDDSPEGKLVQKLMIDLLTRIGFSEWYDDIHLEIKQRWVEEWKQMIREELLATTAAEP